MDMQIGWTAENYFNDMPCTKLNSAKHIYKTSMSESQPHLHLFSIPSLFSWNFLEINDQVCKRPPHTPHLAYPVAVAVVVV